MNIIETNLQFNSNYTTRTLDSIKRIILHHSGVTVLQTIETIHDYHKNTRGYAGIGYHFYVRKDGSIYRGRPIEYIGGHAYGANSDSIGICAEGDFNIETMSEVQENAIKELVAKLEKEYNIKIVQGHREVNNTSCPGVNYPFNEIVNSQAVKEPTQINEDKKIDIFSDGKINCVFDIQEWLNQKYGFDLAQDNLYGPDTHEKMVMALQMEFNKQFKAKLVVDGIFGTKTKSACANIREGAEGNITKLIQMMLFIKGYSIVIDGVFGSETSRIVSQFQKDNELTADAICGKNTFEKLFS